MADLPLNTPAGILVKTTCVDYPELVAGAFFLKGCNIRCPYCYNIGLVLSEREMKERTDYEEISNDNELNSVQELFDLMEKRQGILKGIVISGGEPLINPYTPLIIQKAKTLGYKVKLDTNGTLPDELQAFLDNENLRPDFIAMDLKTSPLRYGKTVCPAFSKFYKNESYWEKLVKRTADIVASLPAENREYRTVLVPSLVTKEDIP
nr:radical SAM protein [Treponema sp.]